MLRRLDERHLPTQATHNLCELDTSRSASEHDQPFGHSLHRGRLVRAPDTIELSQAGNRGDDRVSAIGKDDVVGGVPSVIDLDHSRPGEATAATQQGDPTVGQPLRSFGIGVVRDHEVAPIKRRLHIHLSASSSLACAVHRLPRTQQCL
jgi:hypothetical protein